MTGNENYKRAIEFKGPAYLPCGVGANYAAMLDMVNYRGSRETLPDLSINPGGPGAGCSGRIPNEQQQGGGLG